MIIIYTSLNTRISFRDLVETIHKSSPFGRITSLAKITKPLVMPKRATRIASNSSSFPTPLTPSTEWSRHLHCILNLRYGIQHLLILFITKQSTQELFKLEIRNPNPLLITLRTALKNADFGWLDSFATIFKLIR